MTNGDVIKVCRDTEIKRFEDVYWIRQSSPNQDLLDVVVFEEHELASLGEAIKRALQNQEK